MCDNNDDNFFFLQKETRKDKPETNEHRGTQGGGDGVERIRPKVTLLLSLFIYFYTYFIYFFKF